jgi:hypothetical protein
MNLPTCADCGGFHVEWMYRCQKHGLDYCKGCSCPACEEESQDDYLGPTMTDDEIEAMGRNSDESHWM